MQLIRRDDGVWAQLDIGGWPERRVGPFTGEEALCLALVVDAIGVLEKPVLLLCGKERKRKTPEGRQQLERWIEREIGYTRDWILADFDPQPLSFLRCCEATRMNPDIIRVWLKKFGLLSGPVFLAKEHGLAHCWLSRSLRAA